MKRILFIFIFLGVSFAIDVSDCTIINAEGNYQLINHLTTANAPAGTTTCIRVNTSNVYLDLAGYRIENATGNTAITVGDSGFRPDFSTWYNFPNNITIANGSIVNVSGFGMYIFGMNNSKVYNVTINNNSNTAIYFDYSTVSGQTPYNNTFNLTRVYNSSAEGLVTGGINATVEHSEFINTTYGLVVAATNSNFTNISSLNSTFRSYQFIGAGRNPCANSFTNIRGGRYNISAQIITQNKTWFENATVSQIVVCSVNNVTIGNVTIDNYPSYTDGIFFFQYGSESVSDEVVRNSVLNGTYDGVRFYAHPWTIVNTTILNTGGYTGGNGITDATGDDAFYATIANVTVRNSTSHGVSLAYGRYNVTASTFIGNNQSGMYASNYVHNSTFAGLNASNNSEHGIFLDYSQGSTPTYLENNIFENSTFLGNALTGLSLLGHEDQWGFSENFYFINTTLNNIEFRNNTGGDLRLYYANRTNIQNTTFGSYYATATNPISYSVLLNITFNTTINNSIFTNTGASLSANQSNFTYFYNVQFNNTNISLNFTTGNYSLFSENILPASAPMGSSISRMVNVTVPDLSVGTFNLTLFYLNSDVSGYNESTVSLYRYSGGSWTYVQSQNLDTTLNEVNIQNMSSFGTFALFANWTPPVIIINTPDNNSIVWWTITYRLINNGSINYNVSGIGTIANCTITVSDVNPYRPLYSTPAVNISYNHNNCAIGNNVFGTGNNIFSYGDGIFNYSIRVNWTDGQSTTTPRIINITHDSNIEYQIVGPYNREVINDTNATFRITTQTFFNITRYEIYVYNSSNSLYANITDTANRWETVNTTINNLSVGDYYFQAYMCTDRSGCRITPKQFFYVVNDTYSILNRSTSNFYNVTNLSNGIMLSPDARFVYPAEEQNIWNETSNPIGSSIDQELAFADYSYYGYSIDCYTDNFQCKLTYPGVRGNSSFQGASGMYRLGYRQNINSIFTDFRNFTDVNNTNVTIESRIAHNRTQGNVIGNIFFSQNGAKMIMDRATERIYCTFPGKTTTSIWSTSNLTLSTGSATNLTFDHFLCSSNETSIYIMRNGILENSTASTGDTSLSGRIALGENSTQDERFDGWTDNLFVYDRGMSIDEATTRNSSILLPVYYTNGTLNSSVIDYGLYGEFRSPDCSAYIPTNTSVYVRTRTSNDSITFTDYSSWIACDDFSGAYLPDGRYLQYEVNLATTDPEMTPILYDLGVTYVVPANPIVGPGAGTYNIITYGDFNFNATNKTNITKIQLNVTNITSDRKYNATFLDGIKNLAEDTLSRIKVDADKEKPLIEKKALIFAIIATLGFIYFLSTILGK